MLQLTHPWPPVGTCLLACSAVFLCTDQFGWSTTVRLWDIWRAPEHLLCLLPKHRAEACLIWQRYHGSSHTLTFPAALYTDKGLIQVQSMSKTTGNTLPPRVVLLFGPCSFLTNAENAVPITQMEQFLSTKEQIDAFEWNAWLKEYLMSYL